MSQGKRLVASSTVRRSGWRRRVPTAVVALGSVGAVGAALMAAVSPTPGLDFLPSGHWIYNAVNQVAVHIDGGSPGVDATVPGVRADPGAQVVQGPETGYVVDEHKITVFGTSSLSVQEEIAPPSDEAPLAVEAVGGPYFFYRGAGKIVRLGQPPVWINTGGAFTDPVVTADGTVWLYRPDSGTICSLGRDATTMGSCPAEVDRRHHGSLTLVRDQPLFLDTTADALYPVTAEGLGAGRGLGDGVSDNAELASSDVDGRIAVLDPEKHQLRLIDAEDPNHDSKAVPVAAGDYATPSSTGSAVALVDQKSGKVSTYGGDGTPRGHGDLPAGEPGRPQVSKGEDNRIYVESGQGTKVLVVDRDGSLTDVPVAVKPDPDPNAEKAKPKNDQPPPGGTPPERDERAAPPTGGQNQQQQQQQQRTEKPATPVVPATPPGAPASVDATAGDGSATVTWGAAADNRSAITQYRVSWNGDSTTVSGSARSAKITGLTNGTSYTFSVTAVNLKGRGPAAATDPVTPVAAVKPAAAPGGLQVTPNGTTATVRWTKPSLGGGTLVGYRVTATGQTTKTVTGTSTTFTGLVPGSTVNVTVRAITKTPDGTQVTGTAASKSVDVPTGVVTVRRGDECDEPYKSDGEGQCTKMHVTMTGFQPNTSYLMVPHSDAPTYGNEGSTQQTDANGDVSFDAFDYYAVDFELWVTVHQNDKDGPVLASSPRYKWERL